MKSKIVIGVLIAIIVIGTILGGIYYVNQGKKVSELLLRTQGLQGDLEAKEKSYRELKQSIMCEDTVNETPDYSSNSSVANYLKAFVGEYRGKAINSDWSVLWTNERDSLHRVYFSYDNQVASDVFIVYFDSVEMDYQNSIFWIANQCWLDK